MDFTPAVVCVDGMGTNALATVRALGRRGIKVHVVALKGDRQVVSRSRYCAGCVEVPDAPALPEALAALGSSLGGRPVLYIDNDFMIRLLAPHAAALARRFEIVEPIADAERLTDKAFQLRVAAEAGIPVPQTWFPASWSELREIGRQTGKRIIAKPSPSRLAPGEDPGFKVLICPAAEVLERALRARGARPETLLVQEFIEGDDSQIHVGLAYRARDARCFVLSAKKLRQTQPGAGVMAVGQVLDTPQVRDMTRRMARALGVRGVLSTEFKLDASDGKFYFIEWNPRPAYFHSLGFKAGFDLPWLAYCDHVDARRLPDDRDAAPASRHYWINWRADLQHLSAVPRLALRPAAWRPYLGDKEWALYASDDPRPFAAALAQLCGALPGALMRQLAARFSGSSEVRVAH